MTTAAEQLDCDWVRIPGSQLPPPRVTYLVREEAWRLEEEYVHDRGHYHVHVPAGFEFDLASIPRLFWRLCAPFELSIVAPLMHDLAYQTGGRVPAVHPERAFTRAEADRAFLLDMIAEGVPVVRAVPAYLAVRAFGRRAWRTDA